MSELQPQRRGRRIAMPPEDLAHYLATQRTCRVATVDDAGRPHVSPLWFIWYEDALWLHSLTRSQRWTDLMRNPAISVVIDDGDTYFELRGVEILGTAEAVGPIPRVAGGEPDPVLDPLEAAFTTKYRGGGPMEYDGRHAWLKVTPDKIVSWDFTRIGQ